MLADQLVQSASMRTIRFLGSEARPDDSARQQACHLWRSTPPRERISSWIDRIDRISKWLQHSSSVTSNEVSSLRDGIRWLRAHTGEVSFDQITRQDLKHCQRYVTRGSLGGGLPSLQTHVSFPSKTSWDRFLHNPNHWGDVWTTAGLCDHFGLPHVPYVDQWFQHRFDRSIKQGVIEGNLTSQTLHDSEFTIYVSHRPSTIAWSGESFRPEEGERHLRADLQLHTEYEAPYLFQDYERHFFDGRSGKATPRDVRVRTWCDWIQSLRQREALDGSFLWNRDRLAFQPSSCPEWWDTPRKILLPPDLTENRDLPPHDTPRHVAIGAACKAITERLSSRAWSTTQANLLDAASTWVRDVMGRQESWSDGGRVTDILRAYDANHWMRVIPSRPRKTFVIKEELTSVRFDNLWAKANQEVW